MESVVLSVVVVPILVTRAHETYAELHLTPDVPFDAGAVDGEAKLVGEAVIGAGHVGALDVFGGLPVVHAEFDEHAFVEVDVDDANDALHGGHVTHVGGLEADLLVPQAAEEIRATRGLVEQGRKCRQSGRRAAVSQLGRRAHRRVYWKIGGD